MTTTAKNSSYDADRKAVEKETFGKVDTFVLSVFIVAVFVIANLSSLSHMKDYRESLMPIVRPIAVATGLEQNWLMFASPRKINLHSIAVITFADGSTKMYEYPRMDLLKEWQRFRHGDKLRKLFGENMPEWRGKDFRRDLAANLAECNQDQSNPPVSISYICNFAEVPKPVGEPLPSITNLPRHSKKSIYFVYQVPKNDLASKTSE